MNILKIMEYDKTKHPWGEFLEARKKAIIWMKKERNRNDKEIAMDLSMDEFQVYLIRNYMENNEKKQTSH